jgi:hypothetical protein
MFDDLFDEIDIGEGGSKRTQTILRIAFGVLGTSLAAIGMWHALFGAKFEADGLLFRLAMVNVFAFVGFFSAFNVVLHKPWRWPGRGVLASLVLLFVVRLAFGA